MIKSIQNSEHYKWGEDCDAWHLYKSDFLNVIEECMPSGTCELLHYHEKAEQTFYILSGTATFEINGQIQIISANESIYIQPKFLHRIYNNEREDLKFLLISQPPAQNDRIDIIEFTDELSEPIKTLNVEWLEKYFYVEPGDIISLSNPKTEIIDKGGMIYYAKWKGEIVGTASLLYVVDGVFELSKMAVTNGAQGHYIGNALMEHCIHVASQNNIEKLVLYSNKMLGPAIHLYNKYGFVEVILESGHYVRANIKMEKIIEPEADPDSYREETICLTDQQAIQQVGESGFATIQSIPLKNILIRAIEYSPNFKTDHWCSKGHIIYCLKGELIIKLKDGTQIELSEGQSIQLFEDDANPHITISDGGCRLLVVD